MYNPQVDISIGNYQFDFVNSIVVDSSYKNLTDTATITLPAKLKFDRGTLKDSIKKGDRVVIRSGYSRLETVFSGYVARVSPTTPIVIECEDEMWQLKQIEINDILSKETLKSFMTRNLSDYEIDCFDIDLPKYIASKITAAKLLADLRRDFGFYSFFRTQRLVIGKQYDPSTALHHTCTLHYDIASSELEYRTQDDVKIKVTAISNFTSGEKIEVELGDTDGDSVTRNFFEIQKPELEKLAALEYDKLSYEGFRGSFTWFGFELVKHGDIINLKDAIKSDLEGSYFVDSVIYRVSVTEGIKQEIELGAKIK